MKLAIADPPYPPLFRERFDLAGGASRVTMRSRARRWYGDGPRGYSDSPRADLHPNAGMWDDLDAHRELLLLLVEQYDGWAIATTPDGLGAYHPLPINAQLMSWHKPTAIDDDRLPPLNEAATARHTSPRRVALARTVGYRTCSLPFRQARHSPRSFVGAKPEAWTHWVLDALGYDPEVDELDDLFPGSGAVTAAVGTYLDTYQRGAQR